MQRERKTGPRYELLEESGPSHARHFKVAVFLGADRLGEGEGTSKREAEIHAARQALDRLDVPPATLD
jgi:ribonuclease III